MTSTVTVDEKQVLHAIHDYFQKTGRAECVIALEKSSGYLSETVNVALPDQLAVLRTLCLNGEWNDAIEYLQAFEEVEDKDGFRQCQYELLEQQYLEVLSCKLDFEGTQAQFQVSSKVAIDKQNTLEKARQSTLLDLLSKLRKVCATEEHYTTLLSLTELPTLDDSPHYSTWSMYPGRLNCFHKVATWLSKTLRLDCECLFPLVKTDTTPTSRATTRLVQLLAKGLLYEKCETTCMNRCGEDQIKDNLEIFDLCEWMQQQPDSAYQLSPSRFNLVVLPRSVPSTNSALPVQKLLKSFSIPNTTSSTKSVIRKTSIGSASQSVPEFKIDLSLNDVQNIEKEVTNGRDKNTASPTTENKGLKENDSSGSLHVQGTTSLQGAGLSQIKDVEQPKTTPKKSTGIRIREADSTHHKIRVLEEFENNFVASPPNLRQPHLKTGRDSSTPKPSSNKLHLQPSPPTSPVPFASHMHGTPEVQHEQQGVRDGAEADQRESMPRTRFDFSETAEENSIEWPTATLLGQVSDSQAVRSVAFSQSGAVVAVGANSRTLRLCSTTPLLEGKVSDELAVFYHHPSYHRGSIYCLAWRGETLLVSGSNDQKLRLLSYNPNKPTYPCKFMGEMNFHKGTIRDVVFTPEGQLVSGGAGDPAIMVSDCNTKQVVISLAGHTDQVLALDVVEDSVISSGSYDKTVKLWDLRQGEPFHTFNVDHPVTSLSVSKSRNEILSAHTDGSCTIHDLTSLNKLATYHPHTDECRSAKFCPRVNDGGKGQWIVSGSYDGTVCLADAGSLEWQQIGEHSDKVIQCRWHCGGKVFVTTGADKKACFWTLS